MTGALVGVDRHGRRDRALRVRTLAEILQSVRGFYVSNDRNYNYLGARGFARPGDYNTRILLLLNGHRMNDDVYDQAAIGADFGVDVAMFDRVEVIRGPASSLYGTSAFFAVVNVITRSGASINGVKVDVDAGTLETGMARVSGGRRFASGVDLALSALQDCRREAVVLPAFDPVTNNGVAEHLDGERIGDACARLTAGRFALTAAFGRRRKDMPTASRHLQRTGHTRHGGWHTTVAGEYNRTLAVCVWARRGFDRYDYLGHVPFTSDNAAYRC